MTALTPGTQVEIVLAVDHPLHDTAWWPKEGAVTGTVQRVFKNGQVAVAVHQLANGSKDHFKTMHFDAEQLVVPGDVAVPDNPAWLHMTPAEILAHEFGPTEDPGD